MKKLLTALGTAGLMALTAVPAGASPHPVEIESVDLDDPAVNGAEHACDAFEERVPANAPNRAAQLFRHGCVYVPGSGGGVS